MKESKHVYLPLFEIGGGVKREICEFQDSKELIEQLGWTPSFSLGWDFGELGFAWGGR